jgi:hypothetical protein
MAGDGPVSGSVDVVDLLLNPTPSLLAEVQKALYPSLGTAAQTLEAVGRAVLAETTAHQPDNPVGRRVRVITNDFFGVITQVQSYSDESALEVTVHGPAGPGDIFVTYVEGTDVAARTDRPGESSIIFLDD